MSDAREIAQVEILKVEHKLDEELEKDDSTKAIDLFKFCRSQDEHEWSLLMQRFSSLVSSQSFLVLAFAATANSPHSEWEGLKYVGSSLAVVGGINSALALHAMSKAIRMIGEWRRRAAICLFGPGPQGSHLAPIDRERSVEQIRNGMSGYVTERDIETTTKGRQSKFSDATHTQSLWYLYVTPLLFVLLWIALFCWAWWHPWTAHYPWLKTATR